MNLREIARDDGLSSSPHSHCRSFLIIYNDNNGIFSLLNMHHVFIHVLQSFVDARKLNRAMTSNEEERKISLAALRCSVCSCGKLISSSFNQRGQKRNMFWILKQYCYKGGSTCLRFCGFLPFSARFFCFSQFFVRFFYGFAVLKVS